MPKFCPECGTKLEIKNAKFCPDCGLNLSQLVNLADTADSIIEVEENSIEMDTAVRSRPTVYELGTRFEDTVEKILNAQGWKTEKRKKLLGKSGAKSEIDILAKRTTRGRERVLAVECKNYTNPVPIKDMRDFVSKLEDISIPNGLFTTYSTFSSEAKAYGESKHIQMWDRNYLLEQLFSIEVGRGGGVKEEKIPLGLPLKTSFDEAVNLNLKNSSNVEVGTCRLVWRPFYLISYSLKATRSDPTRKRHQFSDSGDCIIDPFTGDLLDFIHTGEFSFTKLGKEMKLIKEVEEDLYIKELSSQTPESNLVISNAGDFETVILKSNLISPAQIKKRAIQEIIERNTRKVDYRVKVRTKKGSYDPLSDMTFGLIEDDGRRIRSFTFTPKRNEIMIKETKLIFVPKWEIEFLSKDYTYSREIFASSGFVSSDSIRSCPNHIIKGLGAVLNVTVAVCEVCGLALCGKHIFQCPICEKWFCEEHSVKCSSCDGRYCTEDLTLTCADCGALICDECRRVCPICMEDHCKEEFVKCSVCGESYCKTCVTRKKTLLLSKYVCLNCS